jgi:hypothetical protein
LDAAIDTRSAAKAAGGKELPGVTACGVGIWASRTSVSGLKTIVEDRATTSVSPFFKAVLPVDGTVIG